jgi:hypothetical protein
MTAEKLWKRRFLPAKGRAASNFLIHKVIPQKQARFCAKTVPVSDVFRPVGVSFERKAGPQVNENTEEEN